MTKENRDTGRQKREEYPISLDETLKLVKKVKWGGYHRVPVGFYGGGFYGKVKDVEVLLSGTSITLETRVSSDLNLYMGEICLAKYDHKRFGEIYDNLEKREKRSLNCKQRELLAELKDFSNKK